MGHSYITVYHGSPYEIKGDLQPRRSHILNWEPGLFATQFFIAAVVFGCQWHDEDGIRFGSYNRQLYLEETRLGAIQEIFKQPVFVYHLDVTGFQNLPELTTFEQLSFVPKTPLKVDYISDPLTMISSSGLLKRKK